MTIVTQPSIKDIIDKGEIPDVAFFIDCATCAGQGKYPVHISGGPYGCDTDYLQSCNRCYKRSGKRLVRVPFDELVRAVKEMGGDV